MDNAVICQEFVHSFRYSKARKEGAMIKVDLEKAYDRMEWAFVEGTLRDEGLPSKLSDAIMQLITRGSCRL